MDSDLLQHTMESGHTGGTHTVNDRLTTYNSIELYKSPTIRSNIVLNNMLHDVCFILKCVRWVTNVDIN